MAKAVSNFKEVTRTITEQVQDGIVLTLTEQEAKTLIVILNWVGGSPSTTARRHSDEIYNALSNAGYHPESIEMQNGGKKFFNEGEGLYFKADIK